MKAEVVFPVIAIVVLIILIAIVILKYSSCSRVVNAEKFSEYNIQGVVQAPRASSIADKAPVSPDSASSGIGAYSPSNPLGNESYSSVTVEPSSASVGPAPAPTCYPRDRLTAEDLLPKDAANSKWSQLNPIGQGDVQDQNFLTAGYHIGVNTQGQSLRNANYQLRSEPSNPQISVSPWSISTIEPDTNRKALEIGGDF
jgi:hypothetical protein